MKHISIFSEVPCMQNIKYTDSANFRCLENLRETSLDLALVHTGKENCKPLQVFSGTREEYIIHFVLSGSGFYSVNGNTYPLSGGQMFLIYPGETVTYGSPKFDPLTYAWIGFSGIRADAIVKQCGFSRNTLLLPAPDKTAFMPFIDKMLEHKGITYANDLRREACLLMLFSELIDYHNSLTRKSRGERSYSSSVYVELAIEYIKCMYKHGIGVQDIAENVGVSRTHLNQIFQKELGLPVQRFLIDYRMHKAANFLLSTEMTVKEVSSLVGYDDQLTFSKAFKKKFGMSPRNYRTHTETVDNFKEKQLLND